MKVNLIAFQEKAVKELRIDIADAMDSFRRRGKRKLCPCKRRQVPARQSLPPR